MSAPDARALLRAVRWPVAVLVVPALLAGLWVLVAGAGLEEGRAAPLPDARPGAVPDGAPTGTAPTAAVPTEPGGTPLPAAARAGLQQRISDVLAARPIRFAPDRAELAAPAAETAARVAELLLATPGAAVEVVGHAADTPGPPGRAPALSEARAVAVRGVLVAAGVDPARVAVRGAGDTEPLATLAASRRVEIRVR